MILVFEPMILYNIYMFSNKVFLLCLFIFFSLNCLFYASTIYFSTSVPLQRDIYQTKSNHYYEDPRIMNKEFSLLRALGGWDAQWYLKIAGSGYRTIKGMDALSYAFFPLYPIILASLNPIFLNLELTAFVVTNIFLIANFSSMYYVVTRLYSKPIAIRASFLLFLFPFSAFFRYYYAEELFFFLLIWFCYFLIKRRWLLTTLALALLIVTKPQGLLILPIYFYYIWQAMKHAKLSKKKVFVALVGCFIPFLAWLRFCYMQTGNPMYWSTVQSVWYKPRSPFYLAFHNIQTVISFFVLPFHSWHASKVDAFNVILVVFLIFKSKKYLKRELWLMCLFICISPLFLKDTMSYSRYIIVAFPLFIYVASVVKGKTFVILSCVLYVLLLITSVYFVNWYWVA